jgi:transketolase
MQQRDAFITEIYHAALRDANIVLLNADFGAPSLDQFRENISAQFVHCGISEQNMINVAVGMARAGKKVYTYCMAPFVLRAYEQLKLAAVMGAPINVVGVGAGLSYAGSGPTHYSLEDLQAYMALPVDVYTASTPNLAASIARLSVNSDRLNVIRLERGETQELYDEKDTAKDGFRVFGHGIPYIACGYLVHWLRARGHSVIDVYRNKPLSPMLAAHLDEYDHVYTFEEQYGGFGNSIIELLNKHGKKTRVFKRTLPERGIYENGTRDQLLEALL